MAPPDESDGSLIRWPSAKKYIKSIITNGYLSHSPGRASQPDKNEKRSVTRDAPQLQNQLSCARTAGAIAYVACAGLSVAVAELADFTVAGQSFCRRLLGGDLAAGLRRRWGRSRRSIYAIATSTPTNIASAVTTTAIWTLAIDAATGCL